MNTLEAHTRISGDAEFTIDTATGEITSTDMIALQMVQTEL